MFMNWLVVQRSVIFCSNHLWSNWKNATGLRNWNLFMMMLDKKRIHVFLYLCNAEHRTQLTVYWSANKLFIILKELNKMYFFYSAFLRKYNDECQKSHFEYYSFRKMYSYWVFSPIFEPFSRGTQKYIVNNRSSWI